MDRLAVAADDAAGVVDARGTRARVAATHQGQLQKRSATDALTDLPNRMMFEGALADAVRHADETGRRVMEFHESRFADSRSPVHLAAGA